MFSRAFTIAASLAILSAPRSRGQDARPRAFGEGWEKAVVVSNPLLGEGDRYVAWVGEGWLQARRETKAGAVDWHVVLARAEGPEPPSVASGKGDVRFEVSYRGGRYFVREDLNVLRCLRQRKPEGDGGWPRVGFSADAYKPAGSAGAPNFVEGWVGPEGFVTTLGPSRGAVDARVRLSSKGGTSGWGFESVHESALVRAFFKDHWAFDDGELLVATRGLEAVEARQLEVGDLAPDFAAPRLGGGVVKLADYRGKYVLLDFWATWCAPCVAEFPDLRRLHDSHKDGGRFAILGLSIDERPDEPRRYAEAKGLPWAQCHAGGEGETVATRYGIAEIPATFLVGPDGRIIARGLRGEALAGAVDKVLRGDPGKK